MKKNDIFSVKDIELAPSIKQLTEERLSEDQAQPVVYRTWALDRKKFHEASKPELSSGTDDKELDFTALKDLDGSISEATALSEKVGESGLKSLSESAPNFREPDGGFPLVVYNAADCLDSPEGDPDLEISYYDDISLLTDEAVIDAERLIDKMELDTLKTWKVTVKDGYYEGLQIDIQDTSDDLYDELYDELTYDDQEPVDKVQDEVRQTQEKERQTVQKFLDTLVFEYGWDSIKVVGRFSNGEAVYQRVSEAVNRDPYTEMLESVIPELETYTKAKFRVVSQPRTPYPFANARRKNYDLTAMVNSSRTVYLQAVPRATFPRSAMSSEGWWAFCKSLLRDPETWIFERFFWDSAVPAETDREVITCKTFDDVLSVLAAKNSALTEVQESANSRQIPETIDLLYRRNGFGVNPAKPTKGPFGLVVQHKDNVYQDIIADGSRGLHWYRVNITPCKPEDILKNSISAEQFLSLYRQEQDQKEKGLILESIRKDRKGSQSFKESLWDKDRWEAYKQDPEGWRAEDSRSPLKHRRWTSYQDLHNYLKSFPRDPEGYLDTDDRLIDRYTDRAWDKIRQFRQSEDNARKINDEIESYNRWNQDKRRAQADAERESTAEIYAQLARVSSNRQDAVRYKNYAQKKGWFSTAKKQADLIDKYTSEISALENAIENAKSSGFTYDVPAPEMPLYDQEFHMADPEIEAYLKDRDKAEADFRNVLGKHKFYFSSPKTARKNGETSGDFYMDTDDPEVLKRIGTRVKLSQPYGPNRGYTVYYGAPDPREVYEDTRKADLPDLEELESAKSFRKLGELDSTD